MDSRKDSAAVAKRSKNSGHATCLCQGNTRALSQSKATNSQNAPRGYSSSTMPHASGSSGAVLCPACVRAYLQEAQRRRARVLQEHNQLQKECQATLEKSPQWAELQHELMDLRNRSEKLRATTNQVALQTARMACQNEERKASLSTQSNQVVPQRDILRRWQTLLLDNQQGALTTGVLQACHKVRRVRFQWAVAAFQMHRLDIRNVQQMTSRMKHARGIGKIGGLPLPHAGPELYSVLPPAELQSALRLVASLTSLVASCLGIVLPHPILLAPHGSIGDLAATQDTATTQSVQVPSSNQQMLSHQGQRASSSNDDASTNSLSSSTASLASYVGKTALRVLGPTKSSSRSDRRSVSSLSTRNSNTSSVLNRNPASPSTVSSISIPPSLESNAVQQRIHHAMSAVLAEAPTAPSTGSGNGASSSAQHYSLSVGAMQQPDGEEFAIALQLLQNNIVALCIRAGAPVAKLWPAEAVLLNLHVLHEFCQDQAKGGEVATTST
mmetsp:Transcript_27114/g.56790  ORF Transcript_27114/g.56790 Transcript_27114/m.56790 type:complete len:498 (+) Transcript_27114:52-1545(+)